MGVHMGESSFVAKKCSCYRGTSEKEVYFSHVGSPKLGRWSEDNGRIFSPEGQPGTLVGHHKCVSVSLPRQLL